MLSSNQSLQRNHIDEAQAGNVVLADHTSPVASLAAAANIPVKSRTPNTCVKGGLAAAHININGSKGGLTAMHVNINGSGQESSSSQGAKIEGDRGLRGSSGLRVHHDLMRRHLSSAPAAFSEASRLIKGNRITLPDSRPTLQASKQPPIVGQTMVSELPPWRGFNPNPFGPQPHLRKW
jgi:hypothetical protein